MVEKTNSDKKSTLEFAKQQEIEKEAWTELVQEVQEKYETQSYDSFVGIFKITEKT